MDKNVVVAGGIVIGILVLATSLHTGLMIGPSYKLENRRDRTADETDEIYYPSGPALERPSSSSSGSEGYHTPEGSFGGKQKSKRKSNRKSKRSKRT